MNAEIKPITYPKDDEWRGPGVSAAIFRNGEHGPEVLILKMGTGRYEGKYCLPGDFLRMNEGGEQKAADVIKEQTGLTVSFIGQVDAETRPGRDILQTVGVNFFAEDSGTTELRAGGTAVEARWVPVAEVPKLEFFHNRVVQQALPKLEEHNAQRERVRAAFGFVEAHMPDSRALKVK